jgi:hypothetical protein
MTVQTRHLAPVPDPQPEHPVIGLLTDLHLLNAAIRNRQELERVLLTARRAGNEDYSRHVEDAIRSLHLAERRARS